MGSVRAVMASRRNGMWMVRLYPLVGGMTTGRGGTFSEALGQALVGIAAC